MGAEPTDSSAEQAPKPRPPRGLAKDGRRFWRQVTDDYRLRPDELAVLERACRVLDDLAVLDGEMADEPPVVEGSMGQVVAHPLLAERRHHADLLTRLVRQLGLPDEPGVAEAQRAVERGKVASLQAKRAVRARWGG